MYIQRLYSPEPPPLIQLLNDAHDLSGFDSGQPALDNLAVDGTRQRRGAGGSLLVDALRGCGLATARREAPYLYLDLRLPRRLDGFEVLRTSAREPADNANARG